MRRGEQLDGVDVGVIKHLLKGGVDAGGDAPFLSPALGALGHRVAEDHDLAAFGASGTRGR